MMNICAKQETENEALRAKLEERKKITRYADVLGGRVTGPEGLGGSSQLAGTATQDLAPPAALPKRDPFPARPEHQEPRGREVSRMHPQKQKRKSSVRSEGVRNA
ncbi:hypothetical protein HPB47_017529 [Ixodes persulcatus]|uniref:Uncharacterized protein n=1 Tax=Ixodes persulcatus TaxID=34615 RepID=A0AC60QN57_IXOPE|nr:hypothetical protein HPB47_017529 [Ixodes persulcatus]